MKTVYTAMSKHLFYFRAQISQYVLKKGYIPLNPFMIFDYFLSDGVNRDDVRNANNELVKKVADELWVFGPISDGVLNEIKLAKQRRKPRKYFEVINSKEIRKIPLLDVRVEEGIDVELGDL